MKTKYLFITIFMLVTFSIVAQESSKKEMKPFEIKPTTKGEFEKNLNDVFFMMLESAEYPKDKMCVSPEIFRLANEEMKKMITEGKGFLEDYHFLSDTYKKQNLFSKKKNYDIDELAKNYDKGSFKTFESRLAYARANNDTFKSFVFTITGEDIGQLNDDDLEGLKYAYEDRSGTGGLYSGNSFYKKLNEDCNMEIFPNFYIKTVNYPNVVSEFYIHVEIFCNCDDKGKVKLNSSTYRFSADVNGIRTDKTHNYKIPTQSRIIVKSVVCCPEEEKEDESKTALGDSNDDNKGHLQVGAHIGLPLGEESDFYSLVLGADLAYLFNISEDVSIGPGVGYTHFTGKDIGGFKVDGIGFFSAEAMIKYSISNDISIEGNIGYSFSTEENVDGGLNYGVGVGFEIAPGIVIRPEISFINLGDSGNFNSFGIGFLYAFWRK